ncbi:hypothetical protein ES708_20880 [subsurface metagenome]
MPDRELEKLKEKIAKQRKVLEKSKEARKEKE